MTTQSGPSGAIASVLETIRTAPKSLILSYVLDWIAILAIGAIGGGLDFVKPRHRLFSLADPSIGYPYMQDNIPTWLLIVCSLVIPAVVVAFTILVVVPSPRAVRRLGLRKVVKRKLWELNAGWMGLGLSLALAFTVTQAGKVMFSKPRPNLIARCNPDLEVLESARSQVSAVMNLVNTSVCRPKSAEYLDEGFRSFPSGHSSLAWSGLFYVTLFFCAKLSVFFPKVRSLKDQQEHQRSELAMQTAEAEIPSHRYSSLSKEVEILPNRSSQISHGVTGSPKTPYQFVQRATDPLDSQGGGDKFSPVAARRQGAHPPTYLILIVAAPTMAALYIASTRYVLGYHHGFDIVAGSFVGILAAFISFRWHHLPASGGGWAWGPRKPCSAFGAGVGALTYADYVASSSYNRHVETEPLAATLRAPRNDSAGMHPAFRDPRLELPVPASPRGRRPSIAQSTRNSIMLDSHGQIPGPGHTRNNSSPGSSGLVPPQRISVVSFDNMGQSNTHLGV